MKVSEKDWKQLVDCYRYASEQTQKAHLTLVSLRASLITLEDLVKKIKQDSESREVSTWE